MTADAATKFHALLVGADHYFANRLPGGGGYDSLHGCVKDIDGVEAMLRARIEPDRLLVTRLAASNTGAKAPPEDRAAWPTAENLHRALAEITARAAPGDQVYFHYSGHGGRTKTAFSAFKDSLMDEALVPIDIGGDPGIRAERYLRDVQLVGYLDALAQKTDPADPHRRVAVTLVLDACHSGGAARGIALAKRSASGGRPTDDDPTGTLDTTPVPPGTFDEPTLAALRSAWTRSASAPTTRGAVRATTWLPASNSYVLLAACRDSESALEACVDGGRRGGVLTAAFLDALDSLGTEQSWQTLYDRVLGRVTDQFPSQTPQLLGAGDRQVLGVRLVPTTRSVVVLDVDRDRRRVKLGAGFSTAVERGAEFSLCRPGAGDPPPPDAQLAVATVEEPGATTSWAVVDDAADLERLSPGVVANLLRIPGRAAVALRRRDDAMGHALARQDTALAAAAAALGAAAQGFLELVDAAGPRTPRYQVFVDADSYVICDPIGVPLPSVAPLPLDSPHAAERLIERLLRIRRFHCLAELTAPASSLEAQVRVELHRAPAGWRPGDSRTVTDGPLVDPIRVDTDSVLILRVVNGGAQAINFACLDLQCDWAIEPLVPAEDWGEYEVVPANESRDFPLRMYVPPGFAATSDVFMAFVTVADVRFSWIRQPALDRPLERGTHGAARGAARSPAGGLEAIFAAVDAPGHLRLRSADLIASDTAWMVKRLSVTVERAAATADRPHGGAPKAT